MQDHKQIWFTSDTHFFHRNIIKYCQASRGRFKDEEEMNDAIISAWNNRVGENDIVYHLGDVAFGAAIKAAAILSRLNGKKILIKGNHDDRHLKSYQFVNSWDYVADSYLEIMIDDIPVTLCHYPMIEWNHMHRGSYHLYGHVHGNRMHKEQGRRMDVGVDTRTDLAPWSWDEINQYLSEREILPYYGD
jgi:calcineurin-like phosphoesterase family protein